MKKFCAFMMLVTMLFVSSAAMAAEKLTVYTSMKDSLIGALKDEFLKQNPGIEFDAYVAGAGKLMAKIAAERQSGKMVADVLWHSEVPDFYQLKKEGVLEAYKSPNAKFVDSPVIDPDGYFTPARNGTLGIVYNTRFIKTAPKTWKDVLGPDYKDAFGVADPALSGTAYGSVAALVNLYGWDYFKDVQKNGGVMSQGSGQVVDDTAMGDLVACIGVDYITMAKIEKGATLAMAYPKETIVLPSPVGIIKGTPNLSAAQKFVDFLLSKEGQQIIANNYTLPVRDDVTLPANSPLPKPHDAVVNAIKLDFEKMSGAGKEETIKQFKDIMRPGK